VPPEKGFPKLAVVSVGPIIADAIRAVFEDESVSGLFGGDN
jgi:ribose-phosphate pyrophosphokinase